MNNNHGNNTTLYGIIIIATMKNMKQTSFCYNNKSIIDR